MTSALLFAWTLLFGQVHEQRGLASTFVCAERLNNCKLSCQGGRRWSDDEFLVANRDAPCGSVFLVTNPRTGKSVLAVKADAGPWGALMPNGQWVIKRPHDRATSAAVYRGVLDMSPATAKAIGIPGMGYVRIRWWAPLRQAKHKSRGGQV